MKRLFVLLLFLTLIKTSTAQNVGIGTTTPNSSAQLEIASTNKGLLLPRMSSFNRALIINPANGLLVYDTTQNRLYQYQDGSWRFLINNSYWSQSTTRNFVYNSSDSIGIGTTTPSQRLDVNGNIRSRDDVLADGRVIATGLVTGGGLNTSGGLTVSSNGLVGGSFTANGELATNSDLTVNNIGATLQLKNGSNISKGFFQLSGDDVRFGTNSGNALGDVYVRMNGANRFKFEESGRLTLLADNTPTINFATLGVNKASLQLQGENLKISAPGSQLRLGNDMTVDDATGRVGIGTSSPTEKLHVAGNLLVTGNTTLGNGKITSTANGASNNLLPLAYGKISGTGNKTSGTDAFTSANRVGLGQFNIFVNGANSSSVLVLSAERIVVFRIFYKGPNWYQVWVFDPIIDEYADADFHFVMYSP